MYTADFNLLMTFTIIYLTMKHMPYIIISWLVLYLVCTVYELYMLVICTDTILEILCFKCQKICLLLDTSISEIEECFKTFSNRSDIAIILINQNVRGLFVFWCKWDCQYYLLLVKRGTGTGKK